MFYHLGTELKYLEDFKKMVICYTEIETIPLPEEYLQIVMRIVKRIAKSLKRDIRNLIIEVFL